MPQHPSSDAAAIWLRGIKSRKRRARIKAKVERRRLNVQAHLIKRRTPWEARVVSWLEAECIPYQEQVPLHGFYADIVLPLTQTVIELDGQHHAIDAGKDAHRDGALQARGWSILRVWNKDAVDSNRADILMSAALLPKGARYRYVRA